MRLGRLVGVVVALAVGTGCGLSERKLYDKLGKASCEQAFECDSEAASEAWGSEEVCETAFLAEAAEAQLVYRACAYRRKKARRYLKAYKRLDCTATDEELDELDDRWSEVYDCDGGAVGDSAAESAADTGA